MSFGEFLWGMVIFFFWVMYIWMFIAVFGDIFRRDDLSGWLKAGWIFLIFIIPLLGILLYLITRPKMTAQDQQMMEAMQERERRATRLLRGRRDRQGPEAEGLGRHHGRGVRGHEEEGDDDGLGRQRVNEQTAGSAAPGGFVFAARVDQGAATDPPPKKSASQRSSIGVSFIAAG